MRLEFATAYPSVEHLFSKMTHYASRVSMAAVSICYVMREYSLVRWVYNGYARARAAQFIGEQCLVTVGHMLQER